MADIFDKMVAGLNKGVATVGANSKAMIEKAKVNTAIKGLEEERKQLAELLGMKVYTAISEGAEAPREEIANFCSEITKRNDLIAEHQEQLRRIEAETNAVTGNNRVYSATCSCGNVNAEGSKFCAKCGSGL